MESERRRHGAYHAATIAALLSTASTAVPATAETSGGSTGANSAAAQPSTPPSDARDIIIYAPPVFRDIQPERMLDEDAIESYGASTVDELLGEIQVELGSDADQPLIVVNGQRLNDLAEIGALPVEVIRDLQVLPRGSALRLGGTANQRVISLTLKRQVRSATMTAAHKVSTEGNWNADRGEAILTYVKADTRVNVSVRARDESSLLESDRGIIQPTPSRPYSMVGNIVGYPNTSGEIDPLLSALAGETVTVVPLPSPGEPTLSQLAAGANTFSTTNLGAFRTLRPEQRSYDLNSTFATRLAPWLTTNATLRFGRNRSLALRGLPTGLFVLSTANAFSPFSTDVAIAEYGKRAIRSRSRRNSADAVVTFDANFGRWQGNLNLRHSESDDVYISERQKTSGSIALDDNINPFTTDFSSLISVGTDHTSARSNTSLADLTLNGPVAKLPAGDLLATVEGRVGWNKLRSTSTFSTFGNGTFRRNEQTVRGAVEVPLTSRDNDFVPQLGELSASLEYSRSHFSDTGNVNHYTYGFTWEPKPVFRLHGAVDSTSVPAPIQTIGNPVIVAPDVRVFDPLTGQTVDVTQISGGNPALLPQKTTIRNLAALLRLVPSLNLQLNAEYTDSNLVNFVSSLPEASAAVMLAFPDRFIRDSSGVLTTVDLRPVNFASHRQKSLRWGLSMNTKIGGGPPPGTPGARVGPRRPPTYLQLNANHSIVFSDKILIRSGLDPVDLLHGGAIGIGGGRVRHQLDGTASINSGGLGARMGVTWRGPSELDTRIGGVSDTLHFSAVFLLNFRAFADMKRFVPRSRWAKGLRLSLDVINVTNDRQSVRAAFGSTPLQYQRAYRDPLGRTVELELRKIF